MSIQYTHTVMQPSPELSIPQTESLYLLNNNCSFSPPQVLATAVVSPVSMNLTPLATSYKWNHTTIILYWLISLSIMFSRFVKHVSGFHSFLRLSNIPLCVGTQYFVYSSCLEWHFHTR
jgi:hypothetical protein